MGVLTVELGVPYSGWPMRLGADYGFGIDVVSRDLARRLEDWAKEFNACFDEELGWTTPARQAAHAGLGLQLQRLVQEELGPQYRVVLNPLGSGVASS